MEKHCITCKHLEVDEEQTKQLGKAVIFCNRLAQLLTSSVVLHEEKK